MSNPHSDGLSIRVFTDIEHHDLAASWQRIAQNNDCFPQNSYEWCVAWWRHLRGDRSLYVVACLDANKHVIGIAPLCIERSMGLRVLRSFPIHFGDFYTVIIDHEPTSVSVLQAVFRHIKTFAHWDWVRIDNVAETDRILYPWLRESEYEKKHLTDCVIAALDAGDWDAYLGRIKKNLRKDVKKKMRRLEQKYQVELDCLETREEFESMVNLMDDMYAERWEDDYRPRRSQQYAEAFRDALGVCFDRGDAKLYLLKADQRILAYRLGFLHQDTFYDWKTSFDVAWRDYSPGRLIVGYLIRHLIRAGVKNVNFMAGVYDYKLSWSPVRRLSANYAFFLPGPGLRARLTVRYHVAWRDGIRTGFHRINRSKLVRLCSRKVLAWRQKRG